jgi:hypothetical protein
MLRKVLLRVGFGPPLVVSFVCLAISVYWFLTQPTKGAADFDELKVLMHQIYGYVALLPAIFFGTLAFVIYRMSRRGEAQNT